MLAPLYRGWFSSKSGLSEPSSLKRQSKNRNLPETGPFDALEELLGNDLIGIDVGPIHGGDEAGVGGEKFHWME